MTRSVRRGLLGLLLLGLIGAAFADMKATSAEAEVKSIEHALKPEPKLLKLFAFSFYFLFLVSDSARTAAAAAWKLSKRKFTRENEIPCEYR